MSVATAPTAKQSPGAHRACVVCDGSAIEVGAYSRERILRVISNPLRAEAHRRLEVADFAAPLPPADSNLRADAGGSASTWLIDADVRYPEDRWEWRACADLLRERVQRTGDPARVVDVGCGDGRFLRLLQGVPGVSQQVSI
jgi:hypothetical protein